VEVALLKELGNRSFSYRARVNLEIMGDKTLFLEPQGYALQMSEISFEQKERILAEVQKRVMTGEVMGARLGEELFKNPYGDPMISTGLFWWAMNGPLILGVDSFDHKAAWEMLRKMTFDNHARNFPTYWEGYWTDSDALGSSLLPFEGSIPSPFPAYCGHAHAWPLYVYYRLRESSGHASMRDTSGAKPLMRQMKPWHP
jgi:cellobiose phosphorylase